MVHKLSIEKYFSLKQWVLRDLEFSVREKLPITNLKEKISRICFDGLLSNLDNKTKISDILELDESAIYTLLQNLYLDSFFTKTNYDKYSAYLKSGNESFDLEKKLKSTNFAHNLSFMIFLSDDPRGLNQIERASVISKAALDLYSNFQKNNFKTYLNKHGLMNIHLYKYFFSANICPKINLPIDELRINNHSSHIILMFRGQAYKLNVVQDKQFISADEIKNTLEKFLQVPFNKASTQLAIGPLSTASLLKRFELRQSKHFTNKQFFDDLESAIFILCLDSEPYSVRVADNILSYQFQNRYFGNTQIVVGTKGECGVIANYITIEGTQAIEIIDTIYQESLNINFLNQYTVTHLPSKLEIELTSEEFELLRTDTMKILHNSQCNYFLDFGVDFFKSISINPNVTMNFLVMLAVNEIVNNIPVTNHAVSRREHDSPLGQLDWLYISPEKLSDFHLASKKFPELNYVLDMLVYKPQLHHLDVNQQKIYVFPMNTDWEYIIYNPNRMLSKGCISEEKLELALEKNLCILQIESDQYKLNSKQQSRLIYHILSQENLFPNLNSLNSLFNESIEHHKEKISLTKSNLCPTSFFYKPNGEIFDTLIDFYLYLGQFWPAYRNYLFRANRNNKSIDVLISSLRLPSSIQTLGRHGVCSELLTMFGLHVLMRNEQTELVFMPNEAWIDRLEDVVDKIKSWSIKIHLMFYSDMLTRSNS
jgi:hypothetical protein